MEREPREVHSVLNARPQAALDAIKVATLGTLFENDLFLVGGAVRDELLNIPHSADLDLVTTASSLDLANLLASISEIPPVTYPRFGTALLRINGVDIELVTARAESYDENSRKPQVAPASLELDAFRRDFTANSLMKSVRTGELLDLTGKGLSDLYGKILRTPLDPIATFFDDPLRMLRAVRFRWKLGFKPAPGLYDAIQSSRVRLDIVSAERIRDELVKILLHPSAPDALDDLMQLGILERFIPEFVPMVGCEQGRYHHLDVWSHSLLVLKNAWSDDLIVNLSALLHDVGKPPTRSIDGNGNTRFFGHEAVGAHMTDEILKRLKFPQRDIDAVTLLVKNHMRLGSSPTFSSAAARRLLRDLDGETDRLLHLVQADMNGLKAGVQTTDLDKIRERLAEVQTATPADQLVSPLTGAEIMELAQIQAGPEVGRLKAFLMELVLEGTLQPGDKVAAAEAVRSRTVPGVQV
jgi:poly(A) polymerase